jgi:hypothetical protein
MITDRALARHMRPLRAAVAALEAELAAETREPQCRILASRLRGAMLRLDNARHWLLLAQDSGSTVRPARPAIPADLPERPRGALNELRARIAAKAREIEAARKEPPLTRAEALELARERAAERLRWHIEWLEADPDEVFGTMTRAEWRAVVAALEAEKVALERAEEAMVLAVPEAAPRPDAHPAAMLGLVAAPRLKNDT